jgi:CheY-like chemotaxis protein
MSLIYVVDDEPMLLELASAILQPLGYTVRTFRDAESALESFTAAPRRPRLLITDYAMHNMTGLELIEACRAVEPSQKILMVSGTVDSSIYRHAKQKPDRFVAKPYLAAQLIEAVKALLTPARA